VAAWDKLVEDFLPEGWTRSAYDSGWLAGDSDDVDEWVVAAAWKQEDLQWLGDDDSLAAGVYFVYREQPSTSSQVHIIDAFLKLRLWEFFVEASSTRSWAARTPSRWGRRIPSRTSTRTRTRTSSVGWRAWGGRTGCGR